MPKKKNNPKLGGSQGFPEKKYKVPPALKALVALQTYSLPIEGDPLAWLLANLPSSVVRLERPARKVHSNPRSFTGHTYLFSLEKSVPYESSIECDFLERLDVGPGVSEVRAQSLCLEYVYRGSKRLCFPDFEVENDPQSINELPFQLPSIVVEIKSEEDLKNRFEEYSPRFAAAILFCMQNDRQFIVLTENQIRTPYLANAKQLREYIRRPIEPNIRKALLNILRAKGEIKFEVLVQTTIQSISIGQANLVDTLYAMLAQAEIEFDCFRPLTRQSPLWIPTHCHKGDLSNLAFGRMAR